MIHILLMNMIQVTHILKNARDVIHVLMLSIFRMGIAIGGIWSSSPGITSFKLLLRTKTTTVHELPL
jgi:hypothetical protein